MFNGVRNFVVNGGVFVANAGGSQKINLHQLIAEVALNAILNADGRADEVRCYPGTREEVIGKLEKWMNQRTSRNSSRIMWLSGPAGAGKSAICQTVAERRRDHEGQEANFFFFRGDSTRNHAKPLVATLAYQLLEFYPELGKYLTDSLAARPLIHKASFEEQFRHLLSSPMRAMRHLSSIRQPIILIIDGLDECDDPRKQVQIISALHAHVEDANSPFRVLMASRAEHHLVMAFNRISSSVDSIFLDGEYMPQSDVRLFVVGKFDEIKRTHSLAHTLNADWPTQADIQAITGRSSGQFIYAATVMRFIQYSAASPALSLLAIHSMEPATTHNPFAQLDAVYSYVLSKARDMGKVKLMLCAKLVYPDLSTIMQLVGYTEIEVKSLFANLVAIIQVAPGQRFKLEFYHTSLYDYLEDGSRSGIYHVDRGEICAEICAICFQNFNSGESLNVIIDILKNVRKATPKLSKSLLSASTRRFEKSLGVVGNYKVLLSIIEDLYFETDKSLFKLLIRN